ncbi:2-dehydro-3-deoxygluconokinase [Fructilactobacillus fructivorans]|uniref:sugar kinase n=1 Tax=Fructilactobacillus fructivorans TaxID=1614 RepID=UPI0007051CE6|nr:sugar kinase [Fructilactobacillus fructivorans]KRN12979.1 2-dehydro-3-deoxygluconokinase [Fructilactobacillus fructivorans]
MSEFLTIDEPVVTFASTDPDASLADSTHYLKILGGAELNVAIGAKRLGHSAQYVSQVGTDPLGQYAKNVIIGHGVGIDYVKDDPEHWTGHQLKQMVTHGDPKTFNYRTGSAASHLDKDVIDEINLDDVKMAHLTGIFPALSDEAQASYRALMDRLINNKIKITFDPNLRPGLWGDHDRMIKTINELAKSADIVMPGVNEGKVLMGSDDPEQIADFYLQNGERTQAVLIKLGPAGAYVKTKNGDSYTVDGFKVDHVVDTVGAGDGFALGVITALLEDKDLKSAVMRGNAVGAMQVQTPGDNDGYPTQDQLKDFYRKANVSES